MTVNWNYLFFHQAEKNCCVLKAFPKDATTRSCLDLNLDCIDQKSCAFPLGYVADRIF